MTATADHRLEATLQRARSLGFLGPGPLRVHVEHARQFLSALEPKLGERVLDLGSGGGLPGLVLALERPDLQVTLLDASNKRCAFLFGAVASLDLGERVSVLEGRAEVLATEYRESFDVVTARGFGPPAETVECALGYLRSGGRIILSEPPARRRWRSPAIDGCTVAVRTDWPGVVALDLVEGVAPSWVPRSIKQQRRSPLVVMGDDADD